MPQPFKPNPRRPGDHVSSTSGPDIVLQRPELAAQIGNIAANWSRVEEQLAALFAMLMGDYLPSHSTELGSHTSPRTHPVGILVFDRIQAFRSRYDLLCSLAEWRAGEAIHQELRDKLNKRINQASKERSKIVHGQWAINDRFTDALILVPTYSHQEIWKKTDFEAISVKINSVSSDLGKIHHELYEKRRR